MKKSRWLVLVTVICLVCLLLPMAVSAAPAQDGWVDNGNGTWSYWRDGAWVTDQVIKLGDYYYGFDNEGIMYENELFWSCNEAYDYGQFYAGKDGVLRKNAWYSQKEDGEERWYYFGADAMGPNDFQKIDGVWYFFWNGEMVTDQSVYSNTYDRCYALNKAGNNSKELSLGWTSAFGAYYYVYYSEEYGRNIAAQNERIVDGGKSYYLNYDGKMLANDYAYYWDDEQQRDYTILAAADGSLLENGWAQVKGSWYYAVDFDLYDYGIYTIGGSQYMFENYKMLANERIWNSDQGCYSLATADGSLLENGWAQVNGSWYYAENFSLYGSDICEIGGSLYMFDDYKLYNIPGEFYYSYYEEYYIAWDGTLYRNRWRQDTLGSRDEIGWVYYGNDGTKVTGLQEIGGSQYYFNNIGIMQTNCVYDSGTGVWMFDKDGKGSQIPNGWLQNPVTKEYMYNRDGALITGEVAIIGGVRYAFYYDGTMVSNDSYGEYSDTLDKYVYYLFGKDGAQIKTTGWYKLDGSYFYINADGTLAEGWKQSGKNWYYLDPPMRANTVFEDPESDGYYYAANNDGVATLLTGSGWCDLSWSRVYLINGKPVVDDWKYIGGSWYYFNEYGKMLAGEAMVIGAENNCYVFDQDGKMCTGGWVKVDGTRYVDAAGIALDEGLHTIGGKQYLFDDWGYLVTFGGIESWNGTYYWLNADGSVRATMKQGWNEIGGKWYYFNDGSLVSDRLMEIGGVLYGFDSDGVMCSGGLCNVDGNYFIFDASGRVLTGWQNIGGKWYYAEESSYNGPCIYDNGLYYIDDVFYGFKDGVLQTSTSFYLYGQRITTDANGVVTKQQEMQDGWNYTGEGYAYLKNGEGVTGWVGDYFIDNGNMLFNESFEYDGKYYWLGADGRYVRSKWISLPGGAYYYADANGYLACSEWKQIGGSWYYFDDIYMLSDCLYWIDGVCHEFDKNGVWKGEVKDDDTEMPTRGDGWQLISGKWYYYHAGQPVGGTRYIGGQWYAFNYDCEMVTNDFYGGYYYNASGLRAKYVGWKQIDGHWCYFNSDNSIRHGWLKSGSGWYYLEYNVDEDVEKEYCEMVTNRAIVQDGTLYLFNANGYCAGATTKDGWYQAGGEWYYVLNGKVCSDGYIQIGKDVYYFDYSGAMIANRVRYCFTAAGWGYYYFGADGKVVTKAGWKNTENGWIYINAGGKVCYNGIYRIGGVDYSFYNSIWVQ